MIESNLAKEADYDWVTRMINIGYEVILYFLCTDDLDIYYNRVPKRVKEDGHDVPQNIVLHRCQTALMKLKNKNASFQRSLPD